MSLSTDTANADTAQARGRILHTVLENRELGPHSFVLRFERGTIDFEPGQYVSVGPSDDINMREYSVYSPVDADYLEILVREVEGGLVSRRLRKLQPGDKVFVEGPFGFFTVEPKMREKKLVFVASGTGISPFHSISQTAANRDLDFRIIHGVRFLAERYEHGLYGPGRYVDCVSRETGGIYQGRVSSWLREQSSSLDLDAYYFLCGNCDMIYEVYDILSAAGVPADRICAEVYF